MNDLIYVEVTLFFEISDAEIYGGVGTKGYCSYKLGGAKHPENITDEHIENFAVYIAKSLEVPREKIRLISKEEYDANTEEESDCDYEYERWCMG